VTAQRARECRSLGSPRARTPPPSSAPDRRCPAGRHADQRQAFAGPQRREQLGGAGRAVLLVKAEQARHEWRNPPTAGRCGGCPFAGDVGSPSSTCAGARDRPVADPVCPPGRAQRGGSAGGSASAGPDSIQNRHVFHWTSTAQGEVDTTAVSISRTPTVTRNRPTLDHVFHLLTLLRRAGKMWNHPFLAGDLPRKAPIGITRVDPCR